MNKIPADAQKAKVVTALQKLGFSIVREWELISLIRKNDDGANTLLLCPIIEQLNLPHSEQFVAKLKFPAKIFLLLIIIIEDLKNE